MEDDSTAELPLLDEVDPEETVAAIKNQDEALRLLQDLRLQLNTLENTYKRSIRKVDALPLLKRCIAVIEKATGSPPQQSLTLLPIQEFLKNAYTPIGSVIGSRESARVYSEAPRLNASHLKEWTAKREKQKLYQRALENFKYDIYKSERITLVRQNERTTNDRKEELLDLFNRIDKEQQPLNGQRRVLEEVANSTKAPRILEVSMLYKPREIVTRTEIVPMLPCKGYELPRGNLFIAGRSDLAMSNKQLERVEKMQEDEIMVRKEIRKEIISRLCDATKAREDERDERDKDEGILESLTEMTKASACILD